MGGSKNGGTQQPTFTPPPQNNDDMMMQMMAMMMSSMGQTQAPEIPTIESTPPVYDVEVVDWSDKQKELEDKMRADYVDEQSDRVGVEDTNYVSPLLDEEETTQQNVILGAE